ncbi:hypothetical protein V2J09_012452 [Rumex salicifolius]
MPYSFILSGLKEANQTPWNELKSRCLWENTSLVLQLGFFGILLIYLARKFVLSMCKNRLIEVVEVETNTNNNNNNKNTIKTILIILSSALLLGVHLTLLSLILKNHQSDQNQCFSSSFIAVVAIESLQVVSWAITMISPCRIQINNFFGILKFWWICNFLLSFVNSSFLAKRVVDTRELHLNAHDCTDLVALFASTCLVVVVVVSIRTKARVSEAKYDLLTHPLLEDQEQETKGVKKRESLYGKATLTQLITFSWMNPLFTLGKRNALEEDQIPDLDINDSASLVSKSFHESLKKVKSEQGSENPSIYKVIYLFARKKAAINAAIAMISAVSSYVGPYLVNGFVDFLSDKKNKSNRTGYLIVLGFFVAKVVETTAQRQWVFHARQLGIRLRAALVSHIYQKGLVLSTQSRQSHTSGEIINYMSVDVQRITDFTWYLNIVAMLPIQISLAIYVLHTNLGLGSIAGFVATLIVMSCNIPLTRTQKRYQSRIMESKDDRMKSTSEVLRNIKAIKLQAWDDQFLKKLERLRIIEYNWLWKSLRLGAIGAFIFWGSPTFISVITFGSCLLLGIPLTAGRVLSALATFRMLQDPIFSLPDLLNVVAQAKVSADRLASYLQEEEVQKHSIEQIPKDETPYAIEIENGQFSWDPNSKTPTIDGINLRVERGMKVAVCGSVGSGKSSLLSALIGEIQKVCGGVKISGSKAYVPQTPWILTGNIRENILFGSQYDAEKYSRTVKACALEKDFELFSYGDLTEIGERGINMSGGQKQRIQIARAVYQDADIYLLDDPFSAVDAHTGTQLFQECLMGMLKDKSIIYVTHQVEFLPAADLILVMKGGRIAQSGTFNELLSQNIGFEILVGAHNDALESIVTMEASSRASQNTELEQDLGRNAEHDDTNNNNQVSSQDQEQQQEEEVISSKKGKLIQEEERVKGSIDKQVYWYYLTSVKHGALVPLIVLAQSSFQVLQIASNYWIAWSCPTTTDNAQPIKGMDHILLIYMILSVLSSVCVLFRAIGVATHGILASQKLFEGLLCCILRAPMSFFDSTPTGRILNRQYYIPTARELARLTEIQKPPVLHHFAESLTGAATIRAFDQKTRFVDTNLILIDSFSRPFFHNLSAIEWLSYRLNQLSNFVFAFSLVLLVSLPDGVINPSIAGLAVTYGINLNVLQASVIWNICNAENKMISVERILQYTKLKSEAPLIIQESRPTENWPALGTVLKNITCTFPGRKKIGVVGRTGSGKSTLIQAIFRIVEPTEGSIIIDNVDICKIGLHDLRSRLSIIPQDPTMFDGTVRGNLDPLEQHSDAEIWQALEKCQLIDLVNSKEGKLDTTVVENGENWSVGQRQLFCLGRALLKQSSILVLDEATASVDSATDGVIQRIINQEFKDRTIVTIAHRIHTVIDSDLVLVLSDGRIAEYDAPSKLLERENSFFSGLIREYSMRSQSCNN